MYYNKYNKYKQKYLESSKNIELQSGGVWPFTPTIRMNKFVGVGWMDCTTGKECIPSKGSKEYSRLSEQEQQNLKTSINDIYKVLLISGYIEDKFTEVFEDNKNRYQFMFEKQFDTPEDKIKYTNTIEANITQFKTNKSTVTDIMLEIQSELHILKTKPDENKEIIKVLKKQLTELQKQLQFKTNKSTVTDIMLEIQSELHHILKTKPDENKERIEVLKEELTKLQKQLQFKYTLHKYKIYIIQLNDDIHSIHIKNIYLQDTEITKLTDITFIPTNDFIII